jgi:hypothetical protein
LIPHWRQLLWLAVWVTGFAVAMACLLLAFKHRAALDSLQRDRLERVADEIERIVARNLAIGIAFGQIETLPDVLDSQKNAESLVAAIDVIDSEGSILYSTERSRVRNAERPAWLAAISHAKDRPWHATDGPDAAVGVAIRNAFGLGVGQVVVRYGLEPLDQSNRAFSRRLAAWGAGIAVASALLIFAILVAIQSGVERRLARARAALNAEPEDPPRPGSITAEASAARLAIEDANRELDAAEASLAARGAAP